jgi:hypothetical protein
LEIETEYRNVHEVKDIRTLDKGDRYSYRYEEQTKNKRSILMIYNKVLPCKIKAFLWHKANRKWLGLCQNMAGINEL